MRLNFGRRFSRVRIDADDVDAFSLIGLRELLHSLVVAVRYRTTGRDEDNDGAIPALQRIQGVLRAISVRQFEIIDHRANRGRRGQIAAIASTAGDRSQGYDQKRCHKKGNRVLLLHVSELLFKNGWRFNAKISSEKLEVASARCLQRFQDTAALRWANLAANTIIVNKIVTPAESKQY